MIVSIIKIPITITGSNAWPEVAFSSFCKRMYMTYSMYKVTKEESIDPAKGIKDNTPEIIVDAAKG